MLTAIAIVFAIAFGIAGTIDTIDRILNFYRS